jgi:hypothetical protein
MNAVTPITAASGLEITVTVAQPLSRFADPADPDGIRFQGELERLLQAFLRGLGMNVEPLLDVGVDNAQPENLPIRVVFNGRPCRLRRAPRGETPATPRRLAFAVMDIVLDNREALATPELAAEVFGLAAGDARTGIAQRSLATLLRRCLGIAAVPKGADPGADLGGDVDLLKLAIYSGHADGLQGSVGDDRPVQEMFNLLRDGLFYELGIVLPEVKQLHDKSLAQGEFRLVVNQVEFPVEVGLAPGEVFVGLEPAALASLGVQGARAATNPANELPGAICAAQDPDHLAKLQAAGNVWGQAGYVILAMAARLRRHADAYVCTGTMRQLLQTIRAAFPQLCASAQRLGAPLITRVARGLVEEGVPVRDLRGILESLIAINAVSDAPTDRIVFPPEGGNVCPVAPGEAARPLGPQDYVTCARMALRRPISNHHTRGQDSLMCWLVDPAIEKRLRDVSRQPLSDDEHRKLLEAVEKEFDQGRRAVILTTFEVRAALRECLRIEFPGLAVLAYQELMHDLNIVPLGRIQLD